MSKLFVVSVYDSATEAFGTPLFVPAVGGAIRGFTDAVNDPAGASDLCKHPADFVLFSLGEFDLSTGLFFTGVPAQLVRAVDLKSV